MVENEKFNPMDYCPKCASRGRVILHDDYFEEIRCKNKDCNQIWEREKIKKRIICDSN